MNNCFGLGGRLELCAGHVAQIDSCGKHLLSLISDLLDVAKIDAGKAELLLENVALSAHFGQDGRVARDQCWRQAEAALAMVGLPTDAHTTTDGLGAAALKKLELARALATQPRLLLADESLNGLDHAEMDQAADMLQRIRREMNVTIVWVEHIMGVLMRVVDRVVVLDHGEVIFDGAPKAAQVDPRVVEVYLGADAVS